MNNHHGDRTNSTGTMSPRQLWLRWTLATALPASLVFILTDWFVYSNAAEDPEVSFAVDNAALLFLFYSFGLIWIGPLSGIVQGFALGSTPRRRLSGRLVAANTAGLVLATFVTIVVASA